MKAKAKDLAAVLLAESEGKGGKALDEAVRTFLDGLKRTRQLSRVREVMRSVDAAWKDRYGVSKVSVESAHALPVKVQQAIDKLAAGADVSFSVNPALVAGARMRVDDLVIDNTVAGRAERLKKQLMAS